MYTPPSPISRGAMSDDGHLHHRVPLRVCGWVKSNEYRVAVKKRTDNGEKITVSNRYRKVRVLHTTNPTHAKNI